MTDKTEHWCPYCNGPAEPSVSNLDQCVLCLGHLLDPDVVAAIRADERRKTLEGLADSIEYESAGPVVVMDDQQRTLPVPVYPTETLVPWLRALAEKEPNGGS